jgi:predicted membrane protein
MASLPAVLLQPGGDSALLPERNGQGLLNKLLYLPISFIKVAFIEAAQLAVLDRLLLLLLLVGIFFAFRNIRKEESLFFVAIALAVWAIGALNGVMGVNFRYQLPILPYLAWVLLKNLPELSVPKRIKK